MFGARPAEMWPMYVDYSDHECRNVLRSLQLEAYASVVNALRAQGGLTKEKKKMLQDLCTAFSIPQERHRAEIRRAANDEHLNTIADRLDGRNTYTEWAMEGRRVVPLMPRLPPRTLFTEISDSAATAQAEINAMLPLPEKTGVRKTASGLKTMASRKRRKCPSGTLNVRKIPRQTQHQLSDMEKDYLSTFSLEELELFGTNQTSSGITRPENALPPDDTLQNSSSCAEESGAKTSTSAPSTSASTSDGFIKSPPKQIMLKSSPTVTFSSLEQLSSNLSGKSASHLPIITTVKEDTTSSSDTQKLIDSKSITTSSPSITVKAPSFLSSPASSNASSISSDSLSSSSSAPTTGNKFLTQVRCKNPGSLRQNLSLGLKLNSQSQVSPKVLPSKHLPNIKIKQESPSGFFTKKLPQTVFSSSSSDSQNPASSSSLTETSPSKAPLSIPKPTLKTEPLVVWSQPSPKITAVTKTFPKTSSSSSMTRSLFSSATKPGAKALPPVIFNVSSISCTPLQTSTKTTTISVSSDNSKTTPQLLPKSSSVGLTASNLKLSSSNAQTIQYRNDGAIVRNARIVTLSQPVASRLPCATISSPVSSLGLASNLTSSGLHATLPSGTLTTSSSMSSMRVSTASKPNVIVVHKAQMVPRPQQGAAVIVSSAASTSNTSSTTSATSILGSKAKVNIPPASPAVAAATLKIQDPTLLPNPLASKSLYQTTPVSLDNLNSKSQENTEKSKKNFLEVTEIKKVSESTMIKVSPTFKKPFPPSQCKVASAAIKISDPSLLASSIKNKSPANSALSSDSSNSKLQDNAVKQCKKNKSADAVETSEIIASSLKKFPVRLKKPVVSPRILPQLGSASSYMASPFTKCSIKDKSSNNLENLKKKTSVAGAVETPKVVESCSEKISTCGRNLTPKDDKGSASVIQSEPCGSRSTGLTSSVALLVSKDISISLSESKKASPKGGSFEKYDKEENIVNPKLSESKDISESLVSSTSELKKSSSSEQKKSSCPTESGTSFKPDSTVKKTL